MTDPARIPSFSNHLPVRIRFGEGVSTGLGEAVSAQGARRALVVIDAELEDRNPDVAAAVSGLAKAGIAVDRFVKPAGEPTIEIVDAAAAALEEHAPEAVVA